MFVGTRQYRETIDWAAVQAFHDAGHGFVACSKLFGFTHTAWNKAIKRGRLRSVQKPFRDRRRKYDWAEIQRYHDEGHTARKCCERFGCNLATWWKARERGELKTRPLGWEIEKLLKVGKSRRNIKQRLLGAGILQNRCDICGISDWLDQPLSIQIDHINGIRNDNRLTNLRMLCPNCHSQTETFASRNKLRRKISKDACLPG